MKEPPEQGEIDGCDLLGRPLGIDWTDMKRWFFWQWNCPDQRPTHTMHTYGNWSGPIIDETTGWDLAQEKHQQVLETLREQHRPRMLFITLYNSPWKKAEREPDKRIKEYLELREREKNSFLARMCVAQYRDGLHYVLMETLDAPIWKNDEFSEVWPISYKGDLQVMCFCAHGLKHPATGQPIKMKTGLLLDIPLENIAIECPGHGSQKHYYFKGKQPQRGSTWSMWARRMTAEFTWALVRDLKEAIKQDRVQKTNRRQRIEDELGVCWSVTGADQQQMIEQQDQHDIFVNVKITCQRCIHRDKGEEYTRPHTRKKGSRHAEVPFRSPSSKRKQWAKATALSSSTSTTKAPAPRPKAVSKSTAKAQAKVAVKPTSVSMGVPKVKATPKTIVAPKLSSPISSPRETVTKTPDVAMSDDADAPTRPKIAPPPGLAESEDEKPTVDEQTMVKEPKLPTPQEQRMQNETQVITPSLRLEVMQSTRDPVELDLMDKLIKASGVVEDSMTTFMDYPHAEKVIEEGV